MKYWRSIFLPARFFGIILICALLSLTIIINILSIKPALGHLFDFGSFVAAGRESVAGKNPYASNSPLVYQVESQSTNQTLPSPNLNPPVSIILFRPLAYFDPSWSIFAWRIITAVLFGLAVLILARSYPKFTTPTRIIWAFSLAGIWNTILLGQIYVLLVILSISAWIFAERGYLKSAGVMLGCILALKFNFAFWLILLGVRGYRTIVIGAITTFIILSTIPMLIFDFQIYQQWLTALFNYPAIGLLIAGNSSLESLTARLGSILLGTALSLLFAGGSLYLTYRNAYSLSKINTLGIVGSLLILPFSWVGYTILTLPIFFSKQNWSWHFKLSAIILAIPHILVLYFFQKSLIHSILFGWLYGWGLLFIVVGLTSHKEKENPT